MTDYKELFDVEDFDSPEAICEWMEKAESAIKELLARAEAAEARCETLDKLVKEYQETIVPGYRARAENAENIASDLCDDFTDFVTGGVHNAAPYCANNRQECVNAHGWCNGDNSVCRGFLPKAAGIKKEEFEQLECKVRKKE